MVTLAVAGPEQLRTILREDLIEGRNWRVREVPVRFAVGGVELFGTSTDPWLPLNSLDLADFGLLCVREARAAGRAIYPLNEFEPLLLFQRQGEDLLVHSTWTEATVRVGAVTAEVAWRRFAALHRELAAGLDLTAAAFAPQPVDTSGLPASHIGQVLRVAAEWPDDLRGWLAGVDEDLAEYESSIDWGDVLATHRDCFHRVDGDEA